MAQNQYNYPEHSLDPANITKDWFKKYAEACWAEHSNGIGWFNDPDAFNRRATELAAYRMGKQSAVRYKTLLTAPLGENLQPGKSYLNLNESIFQIVPKYAGIIRSIFEKRGYTLQANAVDPISQNEKLREEFTARAKVFLKQMGMLQALDQAAGRPLGGIQDQQIPDSNEELDLYLEMNPKLRWEIAIQLAIKYIFKLSNFDSIFKGLIDDLITVKLAAVHRKTDKRTGEIKLERVKPHKLLLDNTNHEDFRDVRHVGRIYEWSMNELRREAGTELSEEDYKEIERLILQSGFVNGQGWDRQGRVFPNKYNAWQGDKKVRVVYVALYTHHGEAEERRDTGRGFHKVTNIPIDRYNKKYDNETRTDRQHRVRTRQTVYQGYWIPGTGHVFGLEELPNLHRSKKDFSETTLPIRVIAPDVVENTNSSIVERLIPIVDQCQLLWLKMQQYIIESGPPGMAIAIDFAMDVASDVKTGKAYTPNDLIDLYKQKRIMFYKGTDEHGRPLQQIPISDIKSEHFAEIFRIWETIQALIRGAADLIGLNEASDAKTQDKELLVGVMNFQAEATSNALHPIYSAVKQLVEMVGDEVVGALQSQVTKSDLSGYVDAIGRMNIETFELTKDVSTRRFGIFMEDKPTLEEEARYVEFEKLSIQAGSIHPEDASKASRLKDVKLRENYLYLARKRNLQQAEEREARTLQAQAQAQAQEEQAKMASKMQMQQNESAIRRQEAAEQHERAKELLILEEMLASRREEGKLEGQKELQQMKNQNNERLQQMRTELDAFKTEMNAVVEQYKIDQQQKSKQIA